MLLNSVRHFVFVDGTAEYPQSHQVARHHHQQILHDQLLHLQSHTSGRGDGALTTQIKAAQASARPLPSKEQLYALLQHKLKERGALPLPPAPLLPDVPMLLCIQPHLAMLCTAPPIPVPCASASPSPSSPNHNE